MRLPALLSARTGSRLSRNIVHAAVLVLTGGLLTGCKPAPAPGALTEPPAVSLPAGISELSPAEATAWMAGKPDVTVIDTRMPEELEREGKMAGSLNLDYLQSGTLEHLKTRDKQKPYLVYCALGGRSRRLAVQMHDLGFSQVAVLKGGFQAWQKAGEPVVK
ncbi:MAG TPA: rhodanese-like domain-containing protein [Prosthecobacter sp.]